MLPRTIPKLCPQRWIQLLQVRLASGLPQSCEAYLKHCIDKNLNLSSTVFRGTLYELTVKETLQRSLGCFSLQHVGGAGDNGVDLMGRWDLLQYLPKPAPDADNIANTASPAGLLSLCHPYTKRKRPVDLASDIVVLVQCKYSLQRIKASVVRELAGIREFHISKRLLVQAKTTFMLLALPLPMTRQARVQMDCSHVPMVHASIAPRERRNFQEDDYALESWPGGHLKSVYLNVAARDLLAGLSVDSHLQLISETNTVAVQ